VAVVWDLPHHSINYEIFFAVLLAAHEREYRGHEGAFGVGASRAMLPENRHRRIARIAIEDGEAERMHEPAVDLGIFAQLAKLAISHSPKSKPRKRSKPAAKSQ